jgi:hypothetical protein
VTKRPELVLEFTLQPGEAYFINNYTILHARTAFDDGDAPEDARRHLLRLWLDAPIRPVHPYIRSHGILPVAGRTPSFEEDAVQVVRMATSGGAATTPFADTIGALEVGRAADMVPIDWRVISYPYLDPETALIDVVLQRAKTSNVRTVICDGDIIYHDRKFTKVDRDGALRALHEDLQRTLSDDEVERRRLSRALLPHVRTFYANYFDSDQHAPFYRQSSRQ